MLKSAIVNTSTGPMPAYSVQDKYRLRCCAPGAGAVQTAQALATVINSELEKGYLLRHLVNTCGEMVLVFERGDA